MRLKELFTTRLLWLLWLTAVSLFFAVWMLPVSTVLTRSWGLILLIGTWLGLILLVWRKLALRIGFLFITIIFLLFLAFPSGLLPGIATPHTSAATLREGYSEGLSRYAGVRYFWGGESPKGIDCSGLIRRGLVDSLFLRGIRTLDSKLVRHAIWLWWNDCTANDLLQGGGLTQPVLATPSLNALDHSKIQLGDLAVTTSGSHILAYIGGNRWIEADPGIGRVVVVTAPSKDNLWFQCRMKIVRWEVLAQ